MLYIGFFLVFYCQFFHFKLIYTKDINQFYLNYTMLSKDTNIVNMSVGTWMEGLVDCYKLALFLKDSDLLKNKNIQMSFLQK